MQPSKLLLCLLMLTGGFVLPAFGDVILDFSSSSNYTNNFTQVSTTGTVGWNGGGYVEASGGNVGAAADYTPESDFLTNTISMTFQVGAAQSGQVGLYSRVRTDGGAVRAFVSIGRSASSANGSFFNLALNFGGANYVQNSTTGSNFFTGSTVNLGRYLLTSDVLVLTLDQQTGTNPQFRLSLEVNGSLIATSGWQTLANTGFNTQGGVGMYFRPNTLNTVDATSFSIVPEPKTGALISSGFGVLLMAGLHAKKRKASVAARP